MAQTTRRDRARHGRPRLARELTIVMAVKLAILYGIWLAFFQHPIDRHLTGSAIAHAVFGYPTTTTAQNSNVTNKEH